MSDVSAILEKMDGLKEVHNEMQVEQKKFNDQLKLGSDKTQDIEEKLEKMKKSFDTQLGVVEKALARKNQGVKADEMLTKSLQDFNVALKSAGKEEISDLDKFVEVKGAFDRYLRTKTSELTYEDNQILKSIGVDNNGYAIPPEYKSVNTVIDPQGGYFMETQRSSNITEKRFDGHGLFELVGKVNNTKGRFEEIIDWSDYDLAYYKNELEDNDSDQDGENFKLVSWDAKYQKYSKKFSYEALQDIPEVQNHVMSRLLPGAMRQTSDLLVNGTAQGKPRGILSYANGTTYGSVEQVTSATSGKFDFDDVLTTLPSALKDGYHSNANFIMRRATFMSLLSQKDSEGRYQIGNQVNFFDGSGFTAGALGLGGYGIRFEASMPAVASGALAVAFGDFAEAYLYVTRNDANIHRNDSHSDFTKMTLRRRHDGKVKNFEAFKILKIKA